MQPECGPSICATLAALICSGSSELVAHWLLLLVLSNRFLNGIHRERVASKEGEKGLGNSGDVGCVVLQSLEYCMRKRGTRDRRE